MAQVGADVRGAHEAHLGVHVGAVHVHLPAVRMHDLADLADGRLEHTVRRWIRDHQGGERVLVLGGFAAQVFDVDVPAGVRLDGDDGQAGHDRAGRIGAVR